MPHHDRVPERVPLPESLQNFSVAEGRRAGLTDARMKSPDLSRPFHGVRTRHPLDHRAPPIVAMCASYAPLLTDRQLFSHTTAALLWHCPLPARVEPPLPLHVTTMGALHAVRRAGVIGHRVNTGAATVRRRYGFPVSDPIAVFCQLASILEIDDLVAVADHLVLDPAVLDPLDPRPFVSPGLLRAGVGTFRGRGCRAAASAVLLSRPGAESRRETMLRLLLVRAGLPEPEVNPEVYSDEGRWLARADLVYRRWKVIAEYDGDHHRTDRAQYERDQARIERLQDAGWIVVRVRARGLTTARDETVARVERALTRRGWRR